MTAVAPQAYIDEEGTWDSFSLDPRLLQALDKIGFEKPTIIQSSVLPLAIDEKRDIIAKASTGSGKTAAYIIPILHNLLTNEDVKEIQSIILVPTRELADQVHKFVQKLLMYMNNKFQVVNLSLNMNELVLKSLLMTKPEIIVSTPSKLIQILETKIAVNLAQVTNLVIDEVDLILSYGYEEDLSKLEGYLPIKKNLQTFLMSATINDELNELKSKFCTKPAILKLNDDALINTSKLVQYYTQTTEFDKYLLTYVIYKLNLIKGKSLIFVNNIDRAYRLKLFLEQFGLKSCILNSELPINSRLHIIEEFNKNVYNLLIATDENVVEKDEQDDDDADEAEAKEQEEANEDNEVKEEKVVVKQEDELTKKSKKGKNTKKGKKDKEYGVTRGADFRNVACVLNFDLPTSSKAYVHRVGRTARAGKAGMALSFVIPSNEVGKHKTAVLRSCKRDEKVMSRIVKQQSRNGFEIKAYQFDMQQVEGFRYRAEDAFRAVTATSIREARIKELKHELINSNKLKRHFEENPQDLATLRHDKELHPSRLQTHLKRVPEYLLPENARKDIKDIGFVPFNTGKKGKGKKRKVAKKDPLKSFKK